MNLEAIKTVKAIVKEDASRYAVSQPIYKEDYGLYFLVIEGLELPEVYTVDFSNSETTGNSVSMLGNSDGVLIPKQFIDTGKDIFAFLYITGDGFGRTIYKFKIPNRIRPDRTNEEPTPEEQSIIDQAISALNTAVAQTAQDVISAGQSAQSASDDADRAEQAKDDAVTFAQRSANSAQASADYSASASQSAQTSAQSASNAQGYASQASQSAQTASAKADAITGLTATATTLPDGSSATASYDAQTGVMSFGIPKGKDGTNGTNGIDGDDGYSPSVTITDIADGHRVAITDKTGTKNFDVMDGDDYILTEQDKEEIADMVEVPSDWLKAFPTDTASGTVASFTDGANDIPLQSLVVDINPVQDLNGYDSPWVGGNGKNVFDQTLMRDREAWYNIAVKVKPSTQYTISTSLTTTSDGLYCYFNNTNAQGGSSTALVYATHSVTVTSTEDGYVYVSQRRSKGENSFQNYQWQIEEGSTATAYAPYENIRPISGWNGVKVTRSGKNLLPMEIQSGSYNNGVTITVNPDLSITYNKPNGNNWTTNRLGTFMLQAGTYIIIEDDDSAQNGRISLKKLPGNTEIVNTRWNKRLTFTLTEATQIYADFSRASQATDLVIKFMIFKGNTATASDYEPYNGVNVSIDLGQTVYGGTLNPLTGVLTVYPYYASYNGETLTGRWISDRDVYADGTTPTIGAQVVNIGAQGVTVQLEPHEVKSLYGVNNIWADTGDSAVEYRADTKLYINRLTEPDADMIADANITSGQYFMVGNSLYLATANIASGGQVIVGTNAIRKSLSEALNEINS